MWYRLGKGGVGGGAVLTILVRGKCSTCSIKLSLISFKIIGCKTNWDSDRAVVEMNWGSVVALGIYPQSISVPLPGY